MKTFFQKTILSLALFVSAPALLHAQGTAFTYQGRLNFNGSPAAGNFDLRFTVFDTNLNGSPFSITLTNSATPVTNGLFAVTLDFGAGIFTGLDRWLEIAVRTNGGGAFTTLAPRQALTPTPYAIFAGTASNVSGTISPAQLGGGIVNGGLQFTNVRNIFTGDGSGLSGVNADSVNGLHATDFWQTAGNAGTSPTNGNFLGTTDSQPLELRVNSTRALRIEPTTDTPNFIGGYSGNLVKTGLLGVTIGGGGTAINNQPNVVTNNGHYAVIAGGFRNLVGGYGGTVAGGAVNSVLGSFSALGGGQFNVMNGAYATLAGGSQNTNNGYLSSQGGGYDNEMDGDYAFLGGGYLNFIHANAQFSALVGGFYNRIGTNALCAGIAGGIGNRADGPGAFVGGGGVAYVTNNNPAYQGNYAGGISATVPGGLGNSAGGDFSFAAGHQAYALHSGSFVWADNSDPFNFFFSSAVNEFSIRAQNGVRIQSDKGIHLNAADAPLIVRDWDAFAANAPASKAGIGRWGLFMEPSTLTLGIPGDDASGKIYQVAKYNLNGNYTPLMQVNQAGVVSANSFVANGVPLVSSQWAYTGGGIAYNGGNVAIGAANGAYTLDVGGRIRLRQEAGGNTAGLWLYENNPASDRAFIGMNGDGYVGFWGQIGIGWGLYMNVTNGNTTVNGGLQVNAGAGNLELASGGLRVTGAGINTGTAAFTQLTLATNVSLNQTIINNPLCDNNPGAILLVTHNYNPGGANANTVHNHIVGVFYAANKWRIYNEDQTAMATNLAFNVLVIKN